MCFKRYLYCLVLQSITKENVITTYNMGEKTFASL